MSGDGGTSATGIPHSYIGENDCKVASCPRKQEFPKGDNPYCIIHALQNWSYTQPDIERSGGSR